jgi:hypothetical protein
MDSRISVGSRADVVVVESTARPTPTPTRVSFSQVLAAGASGLVRGAELVASALPGSPLAAAAVRGGQTATAGPAAGFGVSPGLAPVNASAEGPSGIGSSGLVSNAATPSVSLGAGGAIGLGAGIGSLGTDPTGGIDASLQQSAQLSLYYLQVQQQVDAQNRSFTALSNILKTEHDSAKAAIQNIHS